MPKSGEDLGVDIYELWLAGERQLPKVAEQFAEANSAFGKVESHDGVFWRPAEFAGGGYGPMHGAFVNLRDTLSAVFRDSQGNLEIAAQALKIAAEEYAATDEVARARFGEMRNDLGAGVF